MRNGPPKQDVDSAPPPVDAHAESPPRPRRWLVFAVVGLALLMITLDQTSVGTALSTLQADLGTSLAWAGWTITAYAVGQIVALPVAGRVADQFGRKRVFLTAVTVFTLASTACGFAPGIELLVVFRFVQGMAGGAFLPSATGLVAEEFGRDRDRGIALFTGIFPIGTVTGPVVGGLVVTAAGWREVFLVNVPIGIVVLVAAALLVRETPRSPGARIDVGGIGLLVAMLVAGMYVIAMLGTGSTGGWFVPVSAAFAGLVAVGCGWLQLRHARRHPAPLVPIGLLTGRGFGAMNVVNVMFGAGALGLAALVPTYAEIRYGFVPLVAGGVLTMRAVGTLAAGAVAIGLLRRLGFRPLLIAGTVLHAVGLVLLAVPPPGVPPLPWLGLATLLCGAGIGLAAPASNNAALHLAPDQIATVSGLRGMFRQVGGIIGISVTTAVVSAAAAPATANAIAFAALAVVLVASIPVVLVVPNHRGRW